MGDGDARWAEHDREIEDFWRWYAALTPQQARELEAANAAAAPSYEPPHTAPPAGPPAPPVTSPSPSPATA